jgi:hypothetical protein
VQNPSAASKANRAVALVDPRSLRLAKKVEMKRAVFAFLVLAILVALSFRINFTAVAHTQEESAPTPTPSSTMVGESVRSEIAGMIIKFDSNSTQRPFPLLDRDLIVFRHLAKTGGTSLRHVLMGLLVKNTPREELGVCYGCEFCGR